ncbi:hypothetical protein [Paraburkholderia sp. J41]|uniref:hypothetical protein n=1 Tax=Paraburkholderia sp. J41 TaxID=2805433 RepID=UPI002AC34CE1|nr:hypothetical protein [Paraburkholderia sp. J41]
MEARLASRFAAPNEVIFTLISALQSAIPGMLSRPAHKALTCSAAPPHARRAGAWRMSSRTASIATMPMRRHRRAVREFAAGHVAEHERACTVPPEAAPESTDGEAARRWALRGYERTVKSMCDVADDLRAGRLETAMPERRCPTRRCTRAVTATVFPRRAQGRRRIFSAGRFARTSREFEAPAARTGRTGPARHGQSGRKARRRKRI